MNTVDQIKNRTVSTSEVGDKTTELELISTFCL